MSVRKLFIWVHHFRMVWIKFSDADPHRDRVFLFRVIRATSFELNVCEISFFHPGNFSLCFGIGTVKL
ncbi:hypothetical protein DWW21_15645 [Blautia obeum]|uniref:Uncharacterized protein n=1 Tax=Blautia obeum TaxID=40520 RepID=A0A395X3H7_9FIRM|nr:hypothetical protein [Blautia obeum]RGV20005.1 hypothetical protein DWW21_15645 [Blautia obeum]RGV60670.1 hypothetical protein DWW07_16525 [Blautia obeum]RKQ26761.1 hypothetical protein D8Q48_12770 [Ruminococcus sp. B05]